MKSVCAWLLDHVVPGGWIVIIEPRAKLSILDDLESGFRALLSSSAVTRYPEATLSIRGGFMLRDVDATLAQCLRRVSTAGWDPELRKVWYELKTGSVWPVEAWNPHLHDEYLVVNAIY
jgi:hypothetical protein